MSPLELFYYIIAVKYFYTFKALENVDVIFFLIKTDFFGKINLQLF